jgi:S1-C subfamily serine protease
LCAAAGSTCSQAPKLIDRPVNDSQLSRLENLDEVRRSIIKVTSSAYYREFYYSRPSGAADNAPGDSLIYYKELSQTSVSGTGLIIHQEPSRTVILTCYHVFNFRDTIETYYLDDNYQATEFLKSRSIKYNQNVYVKHSNGRWSQGEILAMDTDNDLALIETRTEKLSAEIPFGGSFEDANNLKLGEEVYMFGFPKGFFSVTRGIVTPLPYEDRFIVDAPFNKGFSGGVVLSFDETGASYRYAGMANSTAYDSELTLAPYDTPVIDDYRGIPYEGDIYRKELKLINYGLTFVVESNVVSDFLRKESSGLIKRAGDTSGTSSPIDPPP